MEYEFDKHQVSDLSELFGRTRWEMRDAITDWVRQHDATISFMSDLGGRASGRREGLGEISDELHSYGEQLCWHAMFAVAGSYLGLHPVEKSSYETHDKWRAWLNGHALTRRDGLWLADGTDWQPVDTHANVRELESGEIVLTRDPAKLCALLGIGSAIGEWCVIDGDWRSGDGVAVYVSSALVPSGEGDEIAERVAQEEPFHVHLPHLEEHHDPRWLQSLAPFQPWVVQPQEDAGMDVADALGILGAARRVHLSPPAIAFANLTPTDPFGRVWADASGADVLRVEVWSQQRDRGEDGRSTGSRALCRSAFVGRFLAAQDSDLLLLAKLRRTDSGVGERKTRWWHTTLVVRITASLEFSVHPGHANALLTSEY